MKYKLVSNIYCISLVLPVLLIYARLQQIHLVVEETAQFKMHQMKLNLV